MYTKSIRTHTHRAPVCVCLHTAFLATRLREGKATEKGERVEMVFLWQLLWQQSIAWDLGSVSISFFLFFVLSFFNFFISHLLFSSFFVWDFFFFPFCIYMLIFSLFCPSFHLLSGHLNFFLYLSLYIFIYLSNFFRLLSVYLHFSQTIYLPLFFL